MDCHLDLNPTTTRASLVLIPPCQADESAPRGTARTLEDGDPGDPPGRLQSQPQSATRDVARVNSGWQVQKVSLSFGRRRWRRRTAGTAVCTQRSLARTTDTRDSISGPGGAPLSGPRTPLQAAGFLSRPRGRGCVTVGVSPHRRPWHCRDASAGSVRSSLLPVVA